MPIRFRCAYCNQLMGIAKRKAGNVVTCPKCAGQIVVPTPDPATQDEDRPDNAAAIFEEDDEVQKLLEYVEETHPAPAGGRQPAVASAMTAAPLTYAPPTVPSPHAVPQPVVGSTYPQVDVVPLTSANSPPLVPARGIYLTTGVLTIVLVLFGLLIGLAFLLGFLVGRT